MKVLYKSFYLIIISSFIFCKKSECRIIQSINDNDWRNATMVKLEEKFPNSISGYEKELFEKFLSRRKDFLNYIQEMDTENMSFSQYSTKIRELYSYHSKLKVSYEIISNKGILQCYLYKDSINVLRQKRYKDEITDLEKGFSFFKEYNNFFNFLEIETDISCDKEGKLEYQIQRIYMGG